MKELAFAPRSIFRNVRTVVTDMDETLTYEGRLSAAVYEALERLQRAGLKVIVATAAPAGWCDQMARMWPVDGVIGENGGVFFRRGGQYGLLRTFWDRERRAQLAAIGERIRALLPGAALADDQPFRLTSLAFTRTDAMRAAILAAMKSEGLTTTENNLWLLGWFGDYDKLAMARRVLGEFDDDAVCYCGDSENDAPMFRAFRHSIGMSTVRDCPTSSLPAWIAGGPGGAGFLEAANAVLAGRMSQALGN